MTRGFLIFAFNNGRYNYFKHACWIADRIEKYCGHETTIITDHASMGDELPDHMIKFADAEGFSSRNFDYKNREKSAVAAWFNGNRYQAFDMSPYDETIVIDSDYIVNSDQLNLLFESPYSFLTHRSVLDVCDKKSFEGHWTFGDIQFPHYWATVLFFRKDKKAKRIFDLITMIKENYKYYAQLLKFPPRPYRNDHAVSIAQAIAAGHNLDAVPTIPWELVTAPMDAWVYQTDETEFEFIYEKYTRNKVRPMRTKIKGQDFHCMNKDSLEKLVNAV